MFYKEYEITKGPREYWIFHHVEFTGDTDSRCDLVKGNLDDVLRAIDEFILEFQM